MSSTQPQTIRLSHPSGLQLDMMDWGATWLSCRVPVTTSTRREVILGCSQPHDYFLQTGYIGAIIGRYANRIANSSFEINKTVFNLQKNPTQKHQLHGGITGFDKKFWLTTLLDQTTAKFELVSPDGDQGFPGELSVTLIVMISGRMEITIEISATSSKQCPVSISYHPYFNLDGDNGAVDSSDVRQHSLQILSDYFLPVRDDLIPLGTLAKVDDSLYNNAFDFRRLKLINSDWGRTSQQQLVGGFDHAYLLRSMRNNLSPAAVLSAADDKLRLKLFTSMPAIHLYTGQFLNEVVGRTGSYYSKYAGVALEPEFLPDSPNHPEWPQETCLLKPGAVYRHVIRYRFETD